jgi:hypothetical protein
MLGSLATLVNVRIVSFRMQILADASAGLLLQATLATMPVFAEPAPPLPAWLMWKQLPFKRAYFHNVKVQYNQTQAFRQVELPSPLESKGAGSRCSATRMGVLAPRTRDGEPDSCYAC